MAQTANETTRRFCGEPSVPRQACIFADRGVIRFAAGEQTEEDRFEIEAYDGKVIPNHWRIYMRSATRPFARIASDPIVQ
jgi:hypothetical protein